jgi:hypothetical protein
MRTLPFLAGTLCLLLAGASPDRSVAAATRSDVQARLAQAPTEADYPDADAVLLYQEVTYTLDDQGCLAKRVHQRTKLLTEWAVRNLSDLRLGWDSANQELTIHACQTTMRDGKFIETPPHGFNEVTPGSVASCPDFLGMREMVVSHVGVERGAILELEYEVTERAPGPFPPCGREFLPEEWPVLEKTVRVSVPAGTPLRWTAGNGAPEPVAARQATAQQPRYTLTWNMQNLAGLPAEGNEEHRSDYIPYVEFSVGEGWTALAAVLEELSEQAADISSPLRAWLHQTEPPCSEGPPDLTPLDTVQRIAWLIGRRIRSVDLGQAAWHRRPRPASQVFACSCGTPWEKGIVALSLLRETGLKPQLAFCSQGDTLAEDTGAVLGFGEVRVVVDLGGQQVWLSPTAPRATVGRCDLSGKMCLLLDDSALGYRIETLPRIPGRAELVADLRPSQDQDGAFDLEMDLTVSGPLRAAVAQSSTEEIAQTLTEMILPGGELLANRTLELSSRDLHVRFSARGHTLGQRQDGLVMLPLPRPPHDVLQSLPDSYRSSARNRQTPLYLVAALSEDVQLRFQVPDSLKVDYLPAPQQLDLAGAHYSLSSVQQEEVLVVTRSLALPQGAIPPADYPEFHRLLLCATDPAGRAVVLMEE